MHCAVQFRKLMDEFTTVKPLLDDVLAESVVAVLCQVRGALGEVFACFRRAKIPHGINKPAYIGFTAAPASVTRYYT
jgi:hypothetical protein